MFNLIKKPSVQILVIVILTFLAYSNIFANGYITDDRDFIVNWQSKKDFANVGKMLAGEVPENRNKLVFRPLRSLEYMLYDKIFGTNSFGYHLHGILVHMGVTMLVYALVRQMSTDFLRISADKKSYLSSNVTWFPFLTSLMFGLHPIHTEAITFMTSAMDMTGVLFMMGAFWLYLMSSKPVSADSRIHSRSEVKPTSGEHFGSVTWFGWILRFRSGQVSADRMWLKLASVIFAGAAFFTYEITLVLPILIIAYEFYFRPRSISADFRKGGLARILPYFVLAGVFLILRFGQVAESPGINNFIVNGKFNDVVLLIPKIYLKYFELLIWPINLSINHWFSQGIAPGLDSFSSFVYYTRPGAPREFGDPLFYLALIILVVLIWAIFFFWRRARLISFAIAWFFITLLPVSNLLAQPTLMAEKYLYLASFGWCLVAAWLVCELDANVGRINANVRMARVVIVGLIVTIVLGYGVRTYLRNADWRDEIVLWEVAKKIYPKSPVTYYNLGNLYSDAGSYETAASDYKQVTNLLPTFFNAYFNLANVYKKTGDEKSAEEIYDWVITLDPTLLEAHLSLADLYFRRQDFDKALSILEEALKYQDKYLKSGDAHNVSVVSSVYGNCGVLYQLKGDKKQSSFYFKRAVEINPNNNYAKRGLYQVVGEPNFQSITPPTLINEINNYKAKGGYSFDYPGKWKVIEDKEKTKLEHEGVTIEIYLENSDLSFEQYVKSLKDVDGILKKYGFVELAKADKAYARLFLANGKDVSEFSILKAGRIFRILVVPSTQKAEETFDKIVSTINANRQSPAVLVE